MPRITWCRRRGRRNASAGLETFERIYRYVPRGQLPPPGFARAENCGMIPIKAKGYPRDPLTSRVRAITMKP